MVRDEVVLALHCQVVVFERLLDGLVEAIFLCLTLDVLREELPEHRIELVLNLKLARDLLQLLPVLIELALQLLYFLVGFLQGFVEAFPLVPDLHCPCFGDSTPLLLISQLRSEALQIAVHSVAQLPQLIPELTILLLKLVILLFLLLQLAVDILESLILISQRIDLIVTINIRLSQPLFEILKKTK